MHDLRTVMRLADQAHKANDVDGCLLLIDLMYELKDELCDPPCSSPKGDLPSAGAERSPSRTQNRDTGVRLNLHLRLVENEDPDGVS